MDSEAGAAAGPRAASWSPGAVWPGVQIALGVGLVPVIELGDRGVVQLVDHALDVRAGVERPEQWSQATKLPQVGTQCLVGARVLDLDRHFAAVGPDGAMDLADRGGRGGLTVELRESLPPPQAELGVQNLLDFLLRQWWGLGLEFGERLAERLRVSVGHSGLEYAQGLAHLHRAALEFSQDGEHLLGRLVSEFLGQVAFAASQSATAERTGGAARETQWEPGESGCSSGGATGEIGHTPIMTEAAPVSTLHSRSRGQPATRGAATALLRD